mgnify:CR=1 FL=1
MYRSASRALLSVMVTVGITAAITVAITRRRRWRTRPTTTAPRWFTVHASCTAARTTGRIIARIARITGTANPGT